jgi:hypothetical protein
MAKIKFNLDDAMDSSLEGAKDDTDKKVLIIEKKVDKYKNADKLLETTLEKIEEPKITKAKLETKVINLTATDSKRLDDLIDRCMLLKLRVNKSEVLRMGLVSMSEIDDETLIKLVSSIEQLKSGKK